MQSNKFDIKPAPINEAEASWNQPRDSEALQAFISAKLANSALDQIVL